MKTCLTCKLTLPFGEFSKKAKSKDGFCEYCKGCWREKYRSSPGVEKQRQYDSRPERRAALIARRAAYIRQHPERYLAAKVIRSAVYRGTLKKQPCAVCGSARVEGHHADYSMPRQVIWLCPSHHRQAHAASVEYS